MMDSAMRLVFLRRRAAIAGLLALACAGTVRAAAAPVVLVVGDSLSAEYGLKRGSGWVALLQQRLAQQKIAADVINASISGATTPRGGRPPLAPLRAHQKPDLVVLELGANDALRGLPLAGTEANLAQMT